MSIKLVNNNYEIIVASFTDNVYIKITNLINYSSYESTIHSYDSTHECVKTLKNLWNIIVKAFEMMNKYEVNILNPNIDELDNEYVILKLLEQHNNIVLTIYYNLAMIFEFNITLNKIKSEGSIIDITKVKYDLENKDKQITKLQSEVVELKNELNNIFNYLSKIPVYGNQIDSTVVTIPHITKEVDISIYFNLKQLSTYSSLYEESIICKSNTLETIIHMPTADFKHINISQMPNLRCLKYNSAVNFKGNNNLLDQLKAHPNKKNIELVFKDSSYFKDTIEHYKSIGLKSVTVC